MNELEDSALIRAKEIAMTALKGEMNLLLACHKISTETSQVRKLPRELAAVFAAISSESDGLPLGEERHFWDTNSLKEKDKEIDEYSNAVGSVIREAMKQLIAF